MPSDGEKAATPLQGDSRHESEHSESRDGVNVAAGSQARARHDVADVADESPQKDTTRPFHEIYWKNMGED